VTILAIVLADAASAAALWPALRALARTPWSSGRANLAAAAVALASGAASAAAARAAAGGGVTWLAGASGAAPVVVAAVHAAWTRLAVEWQALSPPPPAFDARIQQAAVALCAQLATWAMATIAFGAGPLPQAASLAASAAAAASVFTGPGAACWRTSGLTRKDRHRKQPAMAGGGQRR
jgi:hypothetical protein